MMAKHAVKYYRCFEESGDSTSSPQLGSYICFINRFMKDCLAYSFFSGGVEHVREAGADDFVRKPL